MNPNRRPFQPSYPSGPLISEFCDNHLTHQLQLSSPKGTTANSPSGILSRIRTRKDDRVSSASSSVWNRMNSMITGMNSSLWE